MIKLVLLFAALVNSVFSAPTEDDLIITLPDGQILGDQYTTGKDKMYYGWRGIPFARPPIGDLRFQAPQAPIPWMELRDAAKDGHSCVASIDRYDPADQDEDCLFINVYTPSLKPAEKLPVMFWIYGGAFNEGSARKSIFGPDFLIAEDIIFVSVNYRVGLFGFLSTGDDQIKGNFGLKDQLLGLKWTRQNIALFGGDPEKITIFGESAGGQSVGLQLLSPKSSGLFRGAIVESGSGLTNSSAVPNPQDYAFRLASLIPGGEGINRTQQLKQFLTSASRESLMNAAGQITGLDQHAWPTVEVESDEAFLTESPYVLYESGRFNQVPTILGVCAEEGLLDLPDLDTANVLASLLDRDQSKIIPSDLRIRPDSEDDEKAAISKIKNIYLKGNETFSSNLVGLVKFWSDNKFIRGLLKETELQSQYAPTYLYQFSYFGRYWSAPFIDGVEKASHGAEIPFLFSNAQSASDKDPSNLVVQNRIVKLWTNFAKYLNPTPEASELLNNVIWPTTTPTNLTYLNINGTLKVLQDLKGEQFRSWNETYYSYGEQPFLTF